MKLKELLQNLSVLEMTADPELEIRNVVYDTRKEISPGSLFVAISGFVFDGNTYISKALEQGAVAVVTSRKPETEVPYILVESDRAALATIGANYFGNPAKAMTMIGVTGTNGKTSVTLLLKHVLEKTAGAKVGLIGTAQNMIGDQILSAERTTPEGFELHRLFAQMRDGGCTHVVMEVSSHAIALERVAGIRFQAAAFTNLTEDHLDFHKTMEAYCDTKAILFQNCESGVLNRDDQWFERIRKDATCRLLTTAVEDDAMLKAENIEYRADGIRFTAVTEAENAPVFLGIPGKFTVYNALTVLGLSLQLGVSLKAAAEALATAKGVKGRVEVVPVPGKEYTVLIDYAHTPDGLENILSSVKQFCKGRLIAVFGCGGDRDPVKRPIMGRIGAELADIAIVTSDNPRSEAPMDIISDILKGIPEDRKNVTVIENRVKAIFYAMDIGQKDDIIVLAGKGHETYQEICGVKHHLDEREVVAEHLAEMR